MSKEEPKGYQEVKEEAEKVAEDKQKTDALLSRADKKADRKKGWLGKTWHNLKALIRMVRAYRNGTYTKLPWRAIVAAVAAILYFVNPIDIIPDFLFGIGFLDDASIIAFVMSMIGKDLDKFEEWERDHGLA